MSSDVCLRRCSSDEHPSTNLHQSEFSNGGAWEVYLNTQYDNPVSLRTEPHRGACVFVAWSSNWTFLTFYYQVLLHTCDWNQTERQNKFMIFSAVCVIGLLAKITQLICLCVMSFVGRGGKGVLESGKYLSKRPAWRGWICLTCYVIAGASVW